MQHTHITRALLKGYRNIRNTEATFREGLNIIIGLNGCGKSNFLWLLANRKDDVVDDVKIKTEIDWVVINERYETVNINEKIIHEYVENRNGIEAKINKKIFLNDDGLYEYEYSDIYFYRDKDTLAQLHNLYNFECNSLLFNFNIPEHIKYFTDGRDDIKGNFLPKKSYRLKIENPVLRSIITKINYSEEIFKEKLQLKHLEFDENTIKQLKIYTPIQNIRLKFPRSEQDIIQTEDEIRIQNVFYEFETTDGWYRWTDLSDGTRRIVWLVLNILTTYKNVILIEEPELGIHPESLALFMEFVEEQSKNKQFIITTHSPEVLNIIDPSELDRINIARYDAAQKTTVIEKIPAERQLLIQNYMRETGLLSGYWVHVDLEGSKKWSSV